MIQSLLLVDVSFYIAPVLEFLLRFLKSALLVRSLVAQILLLERVELGVLAFQELVHAGTLRRFHGGSGHALLLIKFPEPVLFFGVHH
jgi:hypothetical protein